MKKHHLIFMCVFALFFTIESCKKKDDINIVTNASVVGNWKGRLSYDHLPDDHNLSINVNLRSDDTITTTYSAINFISLGTYTIVGDSLISTDTTTITNTSINYRFKITNNMTRMDGIWTISGYTEPHSQSKGFIYLDKQ